MHLIKCFQTPSAVLILCMIYVERFLQSLSSTMQKSGSSYPYLLSSKNVHKIVLIAMLISHKYSLDVRYPFRIVSKISGISEDELKILESEFLTFVRYELYVSQDIYQKYLTSLEQFGQVLGLQTAPDPLPPGTKIDNPKVQNSGNESMEKPAVKDSEISRDSRKPVDSQPEEEIKYNDMDISELDDIQTRTAGIHIKSQTSQSSQQSERCREECVDYYERDSYAPTRVRPTSSGPHTYLRRYSTSSCSSLSSNSDDSADGDSVMTIVDMDDLQVDNLPGDVILG